MGRFRTFAANSKDEDKYKSDLESTTLSENIHEIIVGTLLGDSSMSIQDDKPKYSIKFDQGGQHGDYVEHLFELFKDYCGSNPNRRFIIDEISQKKKLKSIAFKTYSLNLFKPYFDMFYTYETRIVSKEVDKNERDGKYPNGKPKFKKKKVTVLVEEIFNKKKIVPADIENLLTEKAIAYWFMDDGTFHDDTKSQIRSFLFSTQGFEKNEVQQLCDVLEKKFKISANVHKDTIYWRIYILRKSTDKFKNLIQKYIIPNFQYKLEKSQKMIEFLEQENQ